MTLDMLRYHPVLLVYRVDLRVQHVHVVVEGVVLFLGLNECGNDLFDVLDPRGLSDLVERIFDHLHVPHVHVTELFLLAIVLGPAVKSLLQDGYRVGELQ